MSVLAFASDDDEAVLDFEAAWTLTMQNLRRGDTGAAAPGAGARVRPLGRSSGPAGTTTAGW